MPIADLGYCKFVIIVLRCDRDTLMVLNNHLQLAPFYVKLECGPMPNVMAALPNIGGALCSTPQSLADAEYWSAVQ